ncbi:hypothetical protein AB7952_04845 [Streptomyces sp. PG2]
MVLSHCRLSGPLVLTRAEIHSDLDLRRTVITAPGRDAVRAVRLSTGGDLLCTGLTVHGLTRVTGAVVAGEFDLEGAHLSNPGGTALTPTTCMSPRTSPSTPASGPRGASSCPAPRWRPPWGSAAPG